MLRTGETCVCDLGEVIGAPQPKISRHLAYLRRAGLVTARKDGQWTHYKLTEASGEFHKSLLSCLSCCFTTVPQLARDLERLGRSKACSDDSCCG